MRGGAPLLEVRDLTKHFPVTRGVLGRVVGQVRAVDGVSFDLRRGETLGLVGESGCGKTTVGRTILRLEEPTAGRVRFEGRDVATLSPRELRALRRDMQIIFQDPFSSLNPRMRVVDIVGEALEVHGIAKGAAIETRVADLLRRVGLPPAWMNRYPHEFSGGQRQRIGVARAIALDPKLIVCDEAVSALDVSIQAQVINLLLELQREMNLSYLFIAHDLSVVRHISTRVAVMYLGQLAEVAPSKRLFAAPAHPYTRALLSAIPVPDPRRQRRRIPLKGDVPTPLNPPSGCRFHTRCPAAIESCSAEEPELVAVEADHAVRCLHAYDLDQEGDWYAQMSERIAAAEKARAARRAAPADPGPEPVRRVAEALPTDAASETDEEEADETNSVDRETAAARWRRRTVAALSAAGALLIVAGSWISGTLLGLGAYMGLLRRRLRRPGRGDAVFLSALLAVSLLGVGARSAKQRYDAQRHLRGLEHELEERRRATGAYPETLDDLGWRLYSVFAEGRPVDPWGRPYFYQAPGEDGRPFDLGSLGPDGVHSGDDLGRVGGGSPLRAGGVAK